MSLIKWYGSKRRLMDWLNANIPKSDYTIDLFFGSGSFSFGRLEAGLTNKILAWDLNPDVVNFWNVIKRPENHGGFLLNLEIDQEFYRLSPSDRFEECKDIWNTQSLSSLHRACLFYTLNKTSFNGLFRTNKDGMYNTSWSKKTSYEIPSLEELRQYARYMAKIQLFHGSYTEFFDNEHLIKPDMVVYLDPPYMAESKNRVDYGVDTFDHEEMILHLFNTKLSCYLSHTVHPEIENHLNGILEGNRRRITKGLTHIANSKAENRVEKEEALYIIN